MKIFSIETHEDVFSQRRASSVNLTGLPSFKQALIRREQEFSITRQGIKQQWQRLGHLYLGGGRKVS